MSSLAVDKQRGHLGILSKSYGEESFFAVNYILRQKRLGRFLNSHFLPAGWDSGELQHCQHALIRIPQKGYIREYDGSCRFSSGIDLRSHKTREFSAPHT